MIQYNVKNNQPCYETNNETTVVFIFKGLVHTKLEILIFLAFL